MDFAADAVLDVVTPPARPAAARTPSASSDEPTFEDHLQAATQEGDLVPEPEVLPGPEQPVAEVAIDASDPAVSLLGGEILPVAPPVQAAPDTTSAPVLIQILSSMFSSAPDASANAKPQTVTPTAPTLPPAPTAPTPGHTGETQNGAGAASVETGVQPSIDKSVAPNKEIVTPAQPVQAPPAPPQTQQAAHVLPTPVAASATPQPAASADAAQAAAALGSMQEQPAPDHPMRQPKAAPAQGDAKAADSAPAKDNAQSAVTAPPRGNAKAVTPQSTVRDTAAFTPLDAPETAPTQQTSSTTPAAAAASTHAQHAVAEESVARAAPAAQQVAREIVRRFDGGNTRFELRLDPPELGRVEVKLEVSRDHRVTAVIAADSPQALTELARHARELEQMLQGAGLELTDNGLSFDLRQGRESAETARFDGEHAGADADAPQDEAPPQARLLGYERWRGVRVDVMV